MTMPLWISSFPVFLIHIPFSFSTRCQATGEEEGESGRSA